MDSKSSFILGMLTLIIILIVSNRLARSSNSFNTSVYYPILCDTVTKTS